MADINKTISVIFTAQDQASASVTKITESLDKVGTEAGGAATKVGALDTELSSVGKATGGIDAATNALKALAASLIIKQFIDANVEAEKFDRTMALLKGSTEAAAAEFDYIKGVANRLGLELFTTGDAYAQLSAATRGTSLEGQATRDIFEAVAQAMGALGKSSADTQGALLAISQIVSKGTVSLEELRGQLGERLPGAFQLAAQSMGLTTQELDKLVSSGQLTAEEFLPRFAAALDGAFGGATFDGYAAAMNRLRNAISEAFVDIGDAGAFDALTTAVNGATATLTGAISAIRLVGETWGNFAFSVNTGDWSGFGDRFRESLDKAASGTKSLTEALFGAETETRKTGDAGQIAGDAIAKAMTTSAASTKDLKAASDELNKSLKVLGVDPKTFVDPVKELESAFRSLATNATATGDQIVTGLAAGLQKLPGDASLEAFRQEVAYAFRDGRLNVEQLNQALALLQVKQDGLAPSFGPVSDAARAQADELRKQSEAAEKAEEKTRAFAIELEKLASNERIKLIEAKVSLNIAQIEANAKTVVASLESIDNTVTVTGKGLEALFGQLSNFDKFSFTAQHIFEEQLETQNARQAEALKLQKELVTAQVENLWAQTRAMTSGDALIKVDGAGLQPHLEAFMWEILKTIQTRVNQDGLRMILGT